MNNLVVVVKNVLVAAWFALISPICGYAAPTVETPEALVKSTVNDVLAAIRQGHDQRSLRELAEQKIVPHFDFTAMTRLAVGQGWRGATPAQQQALESNFQTLLVNTYTAALNRAATGRETVEVKPVVGATVGRNGVTVRTIVNVPNKPPTEIDYRMEKTVGDWKVFDITVEGVSLITNYRGTFREDIDRSGIDGLIKALQAKNQAINNS